MDSTIPAPANLPPRVAFPMGQGFPPHMVPPGAIRPAYPVVPHPNEVNLKINEFTKGIYVSGF